MAVEKRTNSILRLLISECNRQDSRCRLCDSAYALTTLFFNLTWTSWIPHMNIFPMTFNPVTHGSTSVWAWCEGVIWHYSTWHVFKQGFIQAWRSLNTDSPNGLTDNYSVFRTICRESLNIDVQFELLHLFFAIHKIKKYIYILGRGHTASQLLKEASRRW